MNKKVKEARNYFRSIRFTKDEDAQIMHDAKRCGLGVATYLRQKGLGLRPLGGRYACFTFFSLCTIISPSSG